MAVFALALGAAGAARAQSDMEYTMPDLSAWELWESTTSVGPLSLQLRINEPVALPNGGFTSLVRFTAHNEATEERGTAVAQVVAPDLATLFAGAGLAIVQVTVGTDPAVIARTTGITLTPVRSLGSFRFLPSLNPCIVPWIVSALMADGGPALAARSAVIARRLGVSLETTWGFLNPCIKVGRGTTDLLSITVMAADGTPLDGVTVVLVGPDNTTGVPAIASGVTAADGTLGLTSPPEPDKASLIVSPAAIPAGSLVPPGPSTTVAFSDAMAGVQ